MEIKLTKARLVRIEKAYPEKNMGASDLKTVKNTRRGLVSFENKEYYFIANTNMRFPVVFGATPEIMFETLKALDNKMQECGSDRPFFKNGVKSAEEIKNSNNIYYKNGTFIIKGTNNKYIGFMEGAAGTRAVCYRQGGKHYSCSVKSLIKNLEPERWGSMSFRQMESQGIKIKEMIVEFNKAIKTINSNISEKKESNLENKKISINKRTRPQRERRIVKEEPVKETVEEIKEEIVKESVKEEIKEEPVKEEVKEEKQVKRERSRREKPSRRRGDARLDAKREAIRQKQMEMKANANDNEGDDDDDEKDLF